MGKEMKASERIKKFKAKQDRPHQPCPLSNLILCGPIPVPNTAKCNPWNEESVKRSMREYVITYNGLSETVNSPLPEWYGTRLLVLGINCRSRVAAGLSAIQNLEVVALYFHGLDLCVPLSPRLAMDADMDQDPDAECGCDYDRYPEDQCWRGGQEETYIPDFEGAALLV